jgi:hypothetical protein
VVAASAVYLFDANAIVEAVRIGEWDALTGGLAVETVAEVAEECRRGDRTSMGYIAVSEADLARLRAIHPVPEEGRAEIELLPGSDAIHAGEMDLFWYAFNHPGAYSWVCSPDRGAIQFAVAHDLGDHLISLESALRAVGRKAAPAAHFTERWLSVERTKAKLAVP